MDPYIGTSEQLVCEWACEVQERFSIVEKAMDRVPAAKGVGVKKFFCGPESFTVRDSHGIISDETISQLT